MICNAVAFPRSGLPLVAVLVFLREEMLHDCSNYTAVGNDAGVFFDFRKGLHYPHFHLHTAFPLRWNIDLIVPGEPRLVLRRILELIVTMHLKDAEVHFPETGIGS